MATHTDVLIVGGGPVGASLALALAGSGKRVALMEARASSTNDVRPLALSRGAALILQRLGLPVASLDATAIETIHVSQRGGFGRLSMRAAEMRVPALGYVVSYAALAQALEAALPASGTSVMRAAKVTNIQSTPAVAVVQFERDGRSDSISARLVVLADGGGAVEQVSGITVSEHDYRQSALTALVKTELPAGTAAYERFTPTGPVALLPFQGQYALVWTAPTAQADQLATLETSAFLERLQGHFAGQGFLDAGPRATFSLQLRAAKPVTGQRVALIGNAAQTLHPVAGQGFNLGLRDVRALARCILESDRDTLGSLGMLLRYRRMRRWDAGGGIAVTDFLVRGFSNDNALLRAGRGAGLAALDLLPPARKWLARKMMFGISG